MFHALTLFKLSAYVSIHPTEVYPVGISTLHPQQVCHFKGFVTGCKEQGRVAIIGLCIYFCAEVYKKVRYL